MINLAAENGGSDSWGRLVNWPSSMKITDDMVGLSFGSSQTHNRAMLVHLKASLTIQLSLVFSSINCSMIPFFPHPPCLF
ncbi:hypothetical protein LguiA_015098 [Lonicera macranthoides]